MVVGQVGTPLQTTAQLVLEDQHPVVALQLVAVKAVGLVRAGQPLADPHLEAHRAALVEDRVVDQTASISSTKTTTGGDSDI